MIEQEITNAMDALDATPVDSRAPLSEATALLSETLAAAMAGEPVPASSARDAALKAWETIRRNRAAA